jgi:hypothetical protein
LEKARFCVAFSFSISVPLVKQSKNRFELSGGHSESDAPHVDVRFASPELARLDAWIEGQEDAPSRAEAVRRLVGIALGDEPSAQRKRAKTIPVDRLNASNDK